jgi:hypothetical protein
MQDVLDPQVGAYVMETIASWLFGNAAAAVGTLALLALALVLWWRDKVPARLVPQRGMAIMVFCAAGLLLAMGMGARGDELARLPAAHARGDAGAMGVAPLRVLVRGG